jgi:phosphohistidine phosphatase SixA
MRKLLFLLVFLIFIACGKDKSNKRQLVIPEGREAAETTYYLIRHAEKLRNDPANKNPQLSEIGFERGKLWGEYFNNKNLDLFFTTDYLRTFQTLIPIVYNYKGEIEFYEAKDSLFTNEFWKKTYGKNSIIVGHSNTTPKFVNEIIGIEKYQEIPDSINHRLYKVVVDKKGFIAQDTFTNILFE